MGRPRVHPADPRGRFDALGLTRLGIEAAGHPIGAGLLDAIPELETKFHQMWRGPSMGSPPSKHQCAPAAAPSP